MFLVALFVCIGRGERISAQTFALKTNLIYDATTTPNLGLEVGLAPRWTAQVAYGLNPWRLGDGRRIRHWLVMPELRYWTCSRFNGHFFGVHALGGEFNISGVNMPRRLNPFGALRHARQYRYEGYYIGAGLTYGYQWILSRHWNLEASVGAGYAYLNYDRYQCLTCGFRLPSDHAHYWGLTKETLAFIYVF